jgi:type II secretory pathway component GspD/PulD (secretin)
MPNMFAAAVLTISARTYDLTFPAAPVSRIVAALANQSGETLTVDPSVGKEIVALRLHKATLPTAMRRLAEGLNATWRGGKLVRTSDQLSDERQAFANLCRRTLRKDYAPTPRPAYDNPAYIQATQRVQKLEDAKNYAAFRAENPKREALEVTQPSTRLKQIDPALSKPSAEKKPNERAPPTSSALNGPPLAPSGSTNPTPEGSPEDSRGVEDPR